jgi:hypothetical protein
MDDALSRQILELWREQLGLKGTLSEDLNEVAYREAHITPEVWSQQRGFALEYFRALETYLRMYGAAGR